MVSPSGFEPRDPMIKSHVLYQLSYGLVRALCTGASHRVNSRVDRDLLVLCKGLFWVILPLPNRRRLGACADRPCNQDTVMPIVNRIADLHADITEWRRDIACPSGTAVRRQPDCGERR